MSNKPQSSGKSSEWMVAFVTHNITEAHIVAGRLESEGIKAILDHMAGQSAIGLTIGNWGEVRVLVHPSDYELALVILYPEDHDEIPDSTDDIVYYHDDFDDEDGDTDHDEDRDDDE
jgi:hypothetical protein